MQKVSLVTKATSASLGVVSTQKLMPFKVYMPIKFERHIIISFRQI